MTDETETLRETIPELRDVERFVRYHPDTGRIDTSGEQSSGANRIEQLTPMFFSPLRLVAGRGEPGTHYVVRNETGERIIIERPAAPVFDRTTLKAGEGAQIADLTACRVRWDGPVTGFEDHPGGAYEIGWDVPGDYLVTFDPFPAQPVAVTLTVEA